MRGSCIITMTGLLLSAATAIGQTAIEPPRRAPSTIVLDIRAELRIDSDDYEISTEESGLRLSDRHSRLPILSIIEQSPSMLTLEGIIGSLAGTDSQTRQRVVREIERFNTRSSLGTLRVEEKSGRIILSHHLSAAGISAAEISRLTIRFADLAREEGLVIGRMTMRV